MRDEIGSYFEFDNNLQNYEKQNSFFNFEKFEDYTFTFSGRSAIELVIKDILNSKPIKTIYMPSYCCESMIEPLERFDFEIIFYDVFLNEKDELEYSIDENVECDILFLMTYFGTGSKKIDETVSIFKEKSSTVIEDVTHRMFNNVYCSGHADYILGSIRKWLPVMSGGFVAKKEQSLTIKPMNSSNDFIRDVEKSMKLKSRYILGEGLNKNSFLELYSKGTKIFAELEYSYQIDEKSLDILNHFNLSRMFNQRRENARKLYNGLKDLKKIKFLTADINLDLSTPIFVPIILDNRNRDSLRKYLIKNNVYCPVHWPIFSDNNSNIPDFELSLICDQRYGNNEMSKIIKLIRYWYFNMRE